MLYFDNYIMHCFIIMLYFDNYITYCFLLMLYFDNYITYCFIFMFYLAIHCETPSSIANGIFTTSSLTNSTVFGTVVEYTCNKGYKILGPNEITCLPNGQYNRVPPVCQGNLSQYIYDLTTLVTFESICLFRRCNNSRHYASYYCEDNESYNDYEKK